MTEAAGSVAVMVDADGNWVAFGCSENRHYENAAVAKLLAKTMLSGKAEPHRVAIQLPIVDDPDE